MSNWDRKEELKTRAVNHTKEMSANHQNEIAECIAESKIYGGNHRLPQGADNRTVPKMFFVNLDSVSALKKSRSDKKAVLNFASYKNPGGMFINGSSAQEEMLCHESFLYNVLRTFEYYYKWNTEHKNNALYLDRAIYTPNVLFGDVRCDVITCAAPNWGTASKYSQVTKDENKETLNKRLCFIRDVAEENGVKTLILGAFGCGVFKQDPEDVCKAINYAFERTSIKNIVLAVPGDDRNAQVFRKYYETTD